MRKKFLLVGVVTGTLFVGQLALARDIQLRGDDNSGSSTPPPAQQPATTASASPLTLTQRVTRLERILNSQGLEEMLTRMDTLQSEVESLRGDLEVQAHKLDELKQRQRDLYMDIDRRLTRLERNGTAASTTNTPPTTAKQTTGPSQAVVGAGNATAASTTAAAGNAAPAGNPAPTDNPAGEQQAYQKAFDILRNLRYEQAVKAFRAFIVKYPKGRYAHIAQYWIAEAEYAQRKFKQAIVDYQKLIDNYPNSPKLAEAMLKIGYSQYELNNNKAAITILDELIKSYPGTTEAGQAQNLRQKIRLNQ
jgi:tol-pal system protein YbgF